MVFVDGKEWLVKQTTGNTSAHEAEIRGKLVSVDDTSLYPDMLVDEPLFFPSADPPWSAIVTKRPVGRTARGALQEMVDITWSHSGCGPSGLRMVLQEMVSLGEPRSGCSTTAP